MNLCVGGEVAQEWQFLFTTGVCFIIVFACIGTECCLVLDLLRRSIQLYIGSVRNIGSISLVSM